MTAPTPPGFVSVLDEFTLAVPDATGNKRLDSAHTIVETGRPGLTLERIREDEQESLRYRYE